MSIDTIKGQSEKELRGRLNELNAENFKAKFSTEQMNPRKGADIKKRRIEIARIHTVLQGRVALSRRQEEAKKLELLLSGMGQPHEGSVEDKRRRNLVARKLADVRRAVRELSGETAPKAEKPAAKAKPAAEKAPAKAEKPAAEKPAKEAKAEKPKAEKKEAKAEKPKAEKKEPKADAEKPKAKKKADK